MGPLDATIKGQMVVCGQSSAVRLLIQRDMVQATSMGMTVWWPQCDAGEEGVGGGRGQ